MRQAQAETCYKNKQIIYQCGQNKHLNFMSVDGAGLRLIKHELSLSIMNINEYI